MERSEPSLVPEWLKGAGGGGGAAHHSQPPIHQDESGNSFLSRQRQAPHGASAAVNHGDYDSPRYSAASDRAFYPNTRRAATNTSTGASERPLFDRDSYSRAYHSFGRSSAYRGGYEGGLDRERDGPRDRERDWDWERDREREFRDRERDRALGFGGGDDRDRDRDRLDAPNFRRPTAGAAGRYESEAPLRRSQSMGTGRVAENGDKKATADVGALPTAPPANIGTLTSSMQKAAFERNFPSLGAQEKQGFVQSSLGNVSVLSPRPSWQSSSPRPEVARSATLGPGLTSAGSASVSVAASVNVGGSVIGGEGWSSALAEVPSSLSGLPSPINGVVSGASSIPTATSGASALASTAAPSVVVPKMSEALAQHPPRVRTPPQFSLDSPRAEESAAKQARQLILMKPSLPKNMGSRDIIKPKVVRAVDVVAPQPIKLSQPLASQLVSSPYRAPPPPRPELLKAPQGKLLVRKTSKEAVAAMLSPSSSFKGDGGNLTSSVSAAGAVVGMGGTTSSTNASGTLASVPRKQKQLLDRRAVPIPPISVPMGSEGGSGPRSKEIGSVSDDKRPPVPAQNRSDFFNALRKKAAGVGISSGSIEKMETGSLQKNGLNEKGVEAEEETGPFSGDVSQMAAYQVKENGTATSTGSKSNLSKSDVNGISDIKEDAPSNGASTEGAEGNSEQSSTAPSSPVAPTNRATSTEEEEAAFLRSLGWEESEESGEGLTEEEINSFYQERLRSMSISPSLPNVRNHRLRDVQVDLHVGSIGSVSSGMSSSDSDSDDDLRVHRRS